MILEQTFYMFKSSDSKLRHLLTMSQTFKSTKNNTFFTWHYKYLKLKNSKT